MTTEKKELERKIRFWEEASTKYGKEGKLIDADNALEHVSFFKRSLKTIDLNLSSFQKALLEKSPVVMNRRPEVGKVVALNGSPEIRSAYALEKMGLVKTFSLAPYDEKFMRFL